MNDIADIGLTSIGTAYTEAINKTVTLKRHSIYCRSYTFGRNLGLIVKMNWKLYKIKSHIKIGTMCYGHAMYKFE